MTISGLIPMALIRYGGYVCRVLTSALLLVAGSHAAMMPNQRLTFDHLTTGYALIGQHQFVACETCHVGGVFKGTPKQCIGCHNGVTARGKAQNHIQTTATCDTCHRITVSFGKGAVMDHSTITTPCAACHNGTAASGKAATHIATSTLCSSCHRPNTRWVAFVVDHAQVQGTCVSCHFSGNPQVKTSKSSIPQHPRTSDNCESCHFSGPPAKWSPTRGGVVNHREVTGSCANVGCHADTKARQAPLHMPTTTRCEACHVTDVWASIRTVDHGEVSGSCFSCHNGTTRGGRTQKGSQHIPSQNLCDNCHDVPPGGALWRVVIVDHTQVTGSCESCHINGNSYRVRTFKSDAHPGTSNLCDRCHASGPPRGWKPVLRVDHQQIPISTACSVCHNGINAKGKGANHFVTVLECRMCHAVQGWIPANHTHTPGTRYAKHSFDTCARCHDTRPPTMMAKRPFQFTLCRSCHNDDYLRGHSGDPVANPDNCGACHSTTKW